MLQGTLCRLPRLFVVATVMLVLLGSPAGAAEPVTSVLQGAYTKAQAGRGQAIYMSACASCHGTQLQGDSDSPELTGASFLKKWGDVPVGALFAFAESQMPVGRPRSLGAQGYADVVAFILATNGFPAGEQELPGAPALLDKIAIESRK